MCRVPPYIYQSPRSASGDRKRATISFLLGRNDESLKDCDRVFRRNSKYFGALSSAGQIHLRLGHAEQALDLVRRAVAVNPKMEGPAEMIPMLEELVRGRGSSRT